MLYLAVADLLFSISHAIDHLYSVLQIEQGFEEFCIFAAFLLEVFGILVFFSIEIVYSLFSIVNMVSIQSFCLVNWLMGTG